MPYYDPPYCAYLCGTRCIWDNYVKMIDNDFYLACHKAKLWMYFVMFLYIFSLFLFFLSTCKFQDFLGADFFLIDVVGKNNSAKTSICDSFRTDKMYFFFFNLMTIVF